MKSQPHTLTLTATFTTAITFTTTAIATSSRIGPLHAHMHTCIHSRMHMCMHAHMHTCTHAYVHAYMHARKPAHVLTCTHAYMHACTRACVQLTMAHHLQRRTTTPTTTTMWMRHPQRHSGIFKFVLLFCARAASTITFAMHSCCCQMRDPLGRRSVVPQFGPESPAAVGLCNLVDLGKRVVTK
jgi:hypothetical protein